MALPKCTSGKALSRRGILGIFFFLWLTVGCLHLGVHRGEALCSLGRLVRHDVSISLNRLYPVQLYPEMHEMDYSAGGALYI